MKKLYYINNDFVDARLDRWFKKNIFDVPQSLIEKNIRKGNIKVNSKKVKSSYKLKKNDRVVLFNINFSTNKNKKIIKVYKASRTDLSNAKNIFIENNENFVVINKPSGISVQSGTKSHKNLLDILKQTKEFENSSPYTVHRIDKETTGVLIVAKNRKYAQLFTSLFRVRKIYKTYLGIVLGEFKDKSGIFNDILYYYEGERKVSSKAITRYTVVDTNNNFSLLKLSPVTGRKHQLRRQLLMHGHPILGDTKYNIHTKKVNKNSILMLHAYEVNFFIDGIKYKFVADLPLSFKSTLKEKYLKNY